MIDEGSKKAERGEEERGKGGGGWQGECCGTVDHDQVRESRQKVIGDTQTIDDDQSACLSLVSEGIPTIHCWTEARESAAFPDETHVVHPNRSALATTRFNISNVVLLPWHIDLMTNGRSVGQAYVCASALNSLQANHMARLPS